MRPLPFALLLLFAAGNIPASAAPSVLAYYEDYNGTSSSALHARAGAFNQMAVDEYNVTSHGAVTGGGVSADLAFARQNGIQTFATVANFGATDFSPSLAHAVIHSAAAIHNFIVGALRVLAAGRYQGLNIDFESIPARDRNAYTAFLRNVTAHLHARHYRVVVSIPAMTSGDPTDDWSGAFNLPAIGRFVDLVQYMTYDENGPWGDPGPVSGLDWVTACVQYAASVVPPAKLSLGLNAYGYDWDLTDPTASVSVAWSAFSALLAQTGATPQWDATTSSPYFTYTAAADGHRHVVWYENADSLAAKKSLVARYSLNGISVWALGMEDDDFWAAATP